MSTTSVEPLKTMADSVIMMAGAPIEHIKISDHVANEGIDPTALIKENSIHQFTVKSILGEDVPLSKFEGKVLLVVNVASQCGLTRVNYMELEQLYTQYKDKGFEILAFPCNQFGEQEPGTNELIHEFCLMKCNAKYSLFAKVDVNGPNTSPVYNFLKANWKGILGENIKWNFTKFLVDQKGEVIDRYASSTSPLNIEKDIKQLIGLHKDYKLIEPSLGYQGTQLQGLHSSSTILDMRNKV